MKRTSSSGLSIIELVVSLALGSVVLMGLNYLVTPLVLAQVYVAGSANIQLNLAAVDKIVEQDLRQASMVTQPATAGVPSDVLQGCVNATPTALAPACAVAPCPIDSTQPMSWFAVCTAAGVVYYHAGSGCPGPSFSSPSQCETSPLSAFAWGPSPAASLSFVRPSAGSTLIISSMTASSGDASAEVNSAVAFAAPAGGQQ